MKVAGLDGCRGGWVLVLARMGSPGSATVSRVSDLREVLHLLDDGEIAAAGIDIPIGLPGKGSRACDLEARRRLGARRNSVFPAPLRPLLRCGTYGEALTLSLSLEGKGVSRQLFNILPKVRQVDLLMTPRRQGRFVEAHHEVSFATLGGAPMGHYKLTPEGRAERASLVRAAFGEVDLAEAARVARAGADDVLDAFAVAWTAARLAEGSAVRLGGELDERGLRMEIVA